MKKVESCITTFRKSKLFYYMAFFGAMLYVISHNNHHNNIILLISSYIPMFLAYTLFIIEIVIFCRRKQYKEARKLTIEVLIPLLLVTLLILFKI